MNHCVLKGCIIVNHERRIVAFSLAYPRRILLQNFRIQNSVLSSRIRFHDLSIGPLTFRVRLIVQRIIAYNAY